MIAWTLCRKLSSKRCLWQEAIGLAAKEQRLGSLD